MSTEPSSTEPLSTEPLRTEPLRTEPLRTEPSNVQPLNDQLLDAQPLHGDAERLRPHECSRYRAAASHARRVYPGALGELVARELAAFAEFGYRFTGDALIPRLATQVLATPARTDPVLPDAARAEAA